MELSFTLRYRPLDHRRVVLAGLAAGAWPFAARAQQAGMPVIGFMSSRFPAESSIVIDAFRQGLAQAGFVEGRNVGISYRWAEGDYERLPALAAELVKQNVTVIFAAGSTTSARAAKEATRSIPIVFSAAPDPSPSALSASFKAGRKRHRHGDSHRGAWGKVRRSPEGDDPHGRCRGLSRQSPRRECRYGSGGSA